MAVTPGRHSAVCLLLVGAISAGCGDTNPDGDVSSGVNSDQDSADDDARPDDDVLSDPQPSPVVEPSEELPAEGAFSITQSSDPTPESGTLPCSAALGRLMFPQQEEVLVLSATTPETTVSEMVLLVNGREGATISCSVQETGPGAFEVSGTLDGGGRLQFSTTIAGQESTYGWMYWQYEGFAYEADGTCAFSVDARGDGAPFIGAGEAKLTYDCDPLKDEDNQSCVATGTVYLRNCAE